MEEKKMSKKKKVIIGILGAGAGVAGCCLLYHFVKNGTKKNGNENKVDYLLGQIFDETSDRDYELHPIFDAKDCRAIDNHIFTELAPNLEKALLETNDPITVDETYRFSDGVIKKLTIDIKKVNE